MDACKAGSKNKTLQAQAKVSQTARECADRLQEVVTAANLLPGGEGLTLEEDTAEDLDQLAEKELSACAQVIENAARSLANKLVYNSFWPFFFYLLNSDILCAYAYCCNNRPKKAVIGDIGQEGELTDAIVEAARAIAQATAALVKSAHTAQKDRVAKLGTMIIYMSIIYPQ